ncbi:hypothetical protein E8E12_000287 [Didymella heteroderae]|uniref:Uncharacterized protein n=1 Tax=Didymella heteroderae TaxID=1769908 RepID=A0A9P4WNU9_9PLEO|nr:hypothetical protein E8E12_000287 [Didymella heteroderae]
MNLNFNCKALAYPASNLSVGAPVSPCLCFLVFRCDDAKLATLLLVARIPTAHGTADSEFVLQYDADNLMPGHVKLSTGKGHVTQPQLDRILPIKGKGRKCPDIKTLVLSAKHASPVWCPVRTPTFSPQPGCEPAFECLVDVSKATTIHIVFDFDQIRNEYRSSFKAFSKAARGLSGYPVEALLIEQGLRKANWEVFAPTEVAGAPPAYESSRTRKRSRQGSPSSPLQPARCWTPKSPTGSHSSDKTVPISPEAEAAALRQAQLEYYTEVINAAVEKRLAARLDEIKALQAEAIDAAVGKRLDAYFGGPLHAETVDAAVDRQVDAAVQARLPNAVQDLLVSKDPPSSPAQSFTSFDSHGYRYPKLPPLTPASKALLPHLRTHLTNEFKVYQDQQLQRFERLVNAKCGEVESSAYDDRLREHAEWEDEREEHKSEISLLMRDATDDLWREGHEMLKQGKKLCMEFGEDINEQLFGLVEKIDKMNRYSLRKMVVAEVARQAKQQRMKKGIPKGWGRNLLTDPDPRLLGRKRIAEGEWEDV